MSLLGTFRHLLPRSPVWRLSSGKTLTKLFSGLTGSVGDANEHTDQIHVTLNPSTTEEITTFEQQFGLWGTGTESERRSAIDAAWSETGGQSPEYIESQVRAAGFDVYLHQWWTDDAPIPQTQCGQEHALCGEADAQCQEASWLIWCKNPLLYTTAPLIGSVQCGEDGTSGDPYAFCGETDALCSNLLRNDPGYIVNMTLSDNVPPPIPDDPVRWHYFLYFGAATFPDRASVSADREVEFKRLLLKLCPARDWLVLLVDFE